MVLTRFEDFQRRNNRRAQVRYGATVALCVVFYFWCLLGFQSSQEHHAVVNTNTDLARDAWMDKFFRYERYDLASQLDLNFEQRSLLRQQQEEAYRRWKRNESSTVSTAYNFTALSDPTNLGGIKPAADGFLDAMISAVMLLFFARLLFRVLIHFVLIPRLQSLERRQRRRNNRFREWVATLNRQRQAQGERPMSADALRLVLQEADLNGDDYESLLDFQEQAGPAMEELLRTMGATEEEIQRYPSRVISTVTDDLLNVDRSGKMPECAICLEQFTMRDTVRSLPCFHSYHVDCIDPWLAQKALCPICKQSIRV